VTGPGQPPPPPGWYPDPDGTPGLVRWWNGSTWSDVATPAGPGVAVQSSPLLAPPVRPATAPVEEISGEPIRGNRSGWIVVGALLLIVVIGGAALFLGRSGDGQSAASSPTSDHRAQPPLPPHSGGPASPSGQAFPPGTVRIIDEVSGISYPYLGEGWSEWALWNQAETTDTAGQYFVTQELTGEGTTFISQCSSGPLIEEFGYAGPASLAATTALVADSVRGNYYPGPNERSVLRDEDRMVDGHPAHLYEFQLAWSVPGFDASGERAALLLIDVGRPAPALLYISIPNTHAELYGTIDRLLDAVEVL
jgi:hypothetical protein